MRIKMEIIWKLTYNKKVHFGMTAMASMVASVAPEIPVDHHDMYVSFWTYSGPFEFLSGQHDAD